MPLAPKKPCRQTGCPELTHDGYCEKHGGPQRLSAGQRSGVPQQNVDTMQPGSNSDSGSSTMQTTRSVLTVVGPTLPKSITSSRCAIAPTCASQRATASACAIPAMPSARRAANRMGAGQWGGAGQILGKHDPATVAPETFSLSRN